MMYTGVHINNTEDRAVLHTALRRPAEDEGKYIVDGQDTVKDVREVLGRIYAFADKVRSGEWAGVSGKKIETVVNIGIGGSDLGPVMVYEALKPYADAGISARYISNIDPNDLAEKTKGLDPETTLFIVVSKTFTTLETLTNAREARTWLLDALKAAAAGHGTEKKHHRKNNPQPQQVALLAGIHSQRCTIINGIGRFGKRIQAHLRDDFWFIAHVREGELTVAAFRRIHIVQAHAPS